MPATAWCCQNNGVTTRQNILLLWVYLVAIDAQYAGRARLAAFNAKGWKNGSLCKE